MLLKASTYLRSIDHNSHNFLKLSLTIFLILSVLILLRYPLFILEPRFWGEERIYFETFLNTTSWWEGFNTLQYPAYYNLLSRIGGFLSSLVAIENAPLITTLFGYLVLLCPISIIFFTACKYWKNLEQKIILSLFLIFCCSTGEIWLNSTNPHFIFPVTTFLILLDENLKNLFKRIFYCFLLIIGILSGPFTLLMSPFFLFRYLRNKEKAVLFYCSIFLIFGLLHLLFFYISSVMGTGNQNRMLAGSISENLSLIGRLIYLIQFNIVFPIFGYFSSFVFRISMDIANLGIESSYYYNLVNILPNNLQGVFTIIAKAISQVSFIINTVLLSVLGFIFYKLFKLSNIEEKVYFLFSFIYLSILISLLSLGGHGGFRYSYLTSFIILFFLYHKFITSEQRLLGKNLATALVIAPIFIGIAEYYPRVLSFSPSTLFSSTVKVEWPSWKDEIIEWESNNDYKPIVWPYLKNKDLIWPERVAIYRVNLNNHDDWDMHGNHTFTGSLYQLRGINKTEDTYEDFK